MLHHAPPIDKRRARSTASKQKIAEAAEQLVLRKGRSGLTTSALVEVAKVSERTIFNHFKKIDNALTFRVAQHLEPIIDSPPFPHDLTLKQVPVAITNHFHAAVDSPQVQEHLKKFIVLAAALSYEEFEGMTQEIMLTLGTICDHFCSSIDHTYPQLTVQQSLANGLYTVNLLMGVLMGFAAFAQESEQNAACFSAEAKDLEIADIVPYIHRNIDQVASGTPRY